ncbi:50S ribosomal protein L11 methyltransferase [Chitinophagaceae bacterium MMS25-I14]
MQYIQLRIAVTDTLLRELLVARLADVGFEAFEEDDDALLAYVQRGAYNEADVDVLLKEYSLSFTWREMEQQNWNAQWEESFQPVIVPGFCTVRAAFHTIDAATPYEIIITPKMSFGTGHHATTQLMMEQMQHLDFSGKKVFDFGTGTGILAVLAQKLGAADTVAIDNDEWSYENALENVQQNEVNGIEILHGSLEKVADLKFDIVLANINRHILLQYMKDMYGILAPGGQLLMSGLLTEDFEIVHRAAVEEGFIFDVQNSLNNWIVLLFHK